MIARACKVFGGALLVASLACAPPATDPNKGNLTLGAVQTRLENGKTSKAKVLEWFGSPNIATKDRNGEVWNYTRQGTATEVSSSHVGAWMLIASGGSSTGFSRSGSYSFDLLIRFDTHDVVVDYKVLQTAF